MKASKKLFASLAALVVAVSIAATTTYAWFTMNQEVKVGKIDLTVTTATANLRVSTQWNGIYTNSIDITQYIDAALLHQAAIKTPSNVKPTVPFDFKMKDVTYYPAGNHSIEGATAAAFTEGFYGVDKTLLTRDMVTLPKTYKSSTGTTTSAGGDVDVSSGLQNEFTYSVKDGFLSFDLYFVGDGAYKIALSGSSVTPLVPSETNKSPSVAWTNFVGVTKYTTYYDDTVVGVLAQDATIPARASNAVRVMFDSQAAAKPTTPANAWLSELGGPTLSGTPVVKTWEPNATAGLSSLREGKSDADRAGDAGKFKTARNISQDYRAIMLGDYSAVDYDVELTPQFPVYPVFTAMQPSSKTDTLDDGVVPLITLTQDSDGSVFKFRAKTTVHIWLEGWDEDCLNSILSDEFSTLLNFMAIV